MEEKLGNGGYIGVVKICCMDDEDGEGPMIGISEDVDEEGVELDGSPYIGISMEERPFDDAAELEDALDSLSVVGEGEP